MRPRTLALSPDQRAELGGVRDRDPRPYLREAAAALLKVAAGGSPRRVALGGLHKPRKPETVRRWLAKYERGGLAALVHRPRRRRGLSPPAGGGAGAAGAAGAGSPRGGAQPLAAGRPAGGAALPGGYSLSGVGKALRRRRVRLKRGRLRLHRPDPAYAAKVFRVRQVLALARRRPDRVALWFGDECGLYRQPTLAARWFPAGAEPTAALSPRANSRLRVAGGLEAVAGRVVRVAGAKVGVAKLKAFLRAPRAADPDRILVLAQDNWGVHKHPAVLAEAARLRIHLRWLPTYAPETNPIEKPWRWLKQELAHRHARADDREGLKAAARAFLDRFAHGSDDLLRYAGLCAD